MTTTGQQFSPQFLMTPAQAKSARALARSFGHFWADVAPGSLDPVEITVESAKLPSGPCGGIPAPSWSTTRLGLLEHVTSSGRVRWFVDALGDVLVEVSRPDGPCIVAEIYRSVGAGLVLTIHRADEARVCARHVSALLDVATALGVSEAECCRVWSRFPEAEAEADGWLAVEAPRPPVTLASLIREAAATRESEVTW